jgi:hypothetical protein
VTTTQLKRSLNSGVQCVRLANVCDAAMVFTDPP